MACPAKLNLFLHITGKRDDGYHELQSWVVFTEIGDVISIRPAREYHLAVNGPFTQLLPPMMDNLVTKTVNLLAERYKQKPNFVIELTKNLPIGGGLGGGSANAAATARALQQLWGFEWSTEDAAWLAHHIGADVPVCLAGQSCIVGGIGEKLESFAPMPSGYHVVLVFPNVSVSTSEIFGKIQPPYTPPIDFPADKISESLMQFIQSARNDLMHPAMSIEGNVIKAYRALMRQENCTLARMTGSGSVCFGIFPDADSARNATAAIRQEEPAWWVRATQFLTA